MAKPRKSRENRQGHEKQLKTEIIVVVEGSVTEPAYFERLVRSSDRNKRLAEAGYVFTLVKKKARESGIEQLIDKINEEIEEVKPKPYEAWIVCDNDGPAEDHKQKLKSWDREGKGKHHIALSTPCFEYWLLLHCCDKSKTFCKGGDNKSIQKRLMEEGCDCLEGDGGKKHLKESFLKKLAGDDFIEVAISSAEAIPENAKCRTDVHKLVRKLIAPAPPEA